MFRHTMFGLTACTALALPAMAQDESDLMAVLQADNGFSTFVSLIDDAGLTQTLMNDGPYTLFAPRNESFDKMDPAKLSSLKEPENQGALQELIWLHIVRGQYDLTQLQAAKSVTTVGDQSLQITTGDSGTMVNGTLIVTPDQEASNGYLDVVAGVLAPD